MFNFTDLGLIFDLAGAVFLALGVIFELKNPRQTLFKSMALSDYNPDLLKSNFQHIFNTFIGTILLILGFVGQFIGNLYPTAFIPVCIFAFAVGALTFLSVMLYKGSGKFAEKRIQKLRNDKLIPGHGTI